MSRRDARHGSSPRHELTSAATLATLDKTGPRRITDLAVAEGVTQPAMTVLVRVMEESGLVERKKDPSDKRVTLVYLTEAGGAAASGGARKPRPRGAGPVSASHVSLDSAQWTRWI